MDNLILACRVRGVPAGVIYEIERVSHLDCGREFARDWLRVYFKCKARAGFDTIGAKIKSK